MDLYEELAVAFVFVLVTAIVLFVFRKLLQERKRKSINDSVSAKSGHYWTRVNFVDRGFFCASCKKHLLSGYECDYCTLKVDEVACARNVASKLACKTIQKPDSDGEFHHHWIPGNIDSDQFCFICDELCGGGISLRDFSCCLCWRVIHTSCMKKLSLDVCDFGRYRSFTFPPNAVVTRKTGKKLVIDRLLLPKIDDFKPIIALTNTVCGSCTGKVVYRNLLRRLHPMQPNFSAKKLKRDCPKFQVIDVQKENVKSALQWIDEYPEVNVRLVVAGGDGTISNVLETLEQFQRKPPCDTCFLHNMPIIKLMSIMANVPIQMAVLPLGTGNDLSRVLGWGSGTNGDLDMLEYLSDVYAADVQKLDRWKVMIKSKNQRTRKSIPRVLSSRLLNKLLFFSFGTKDVFTRTCKGLRENISLYLDDKLVDLPDIEGIVFLNIQCWGAGVQPWKYADEEYPQAIDDGIFEVFAVTSSFHIAQMQVGLASPLFIGQARKAVVVTKNGAKLPMQW
ncbi:unnamed protein product [Nippostrongylus brasiliensis]|uniref:Diacylglycerol kinase n=1 Tax=Nippostrongylus brasiliensis TaxID=27835 RepID=A0A158R362_NIPBR|nr:unnamed protein product [Nippostrongylus brasiliensis]